MFHRLLRGWFLVTVLAASGGWLAGCGTSSAAAVPPVVTIPKGQGVFSPYILPVEPRTRITWHNQDTVAHMIMSTPDHTSYLNPSAIALTVPAGGSVSTTLTQPGIYDYFDTTMAQWNGDDHRVSANAGTPAYPLAMEGVIWVQGKIGGLPSSVTNLIPGKDLFATDFLAIPSGGSVYFYDGDTDPHTVTEVPGWPAPVNPASFTALSLNGTDAAPPNGETHQLTLDTPGLYYYHCAHHSDVETHWHRVTPKKESSEFPIPMEGFILVVPS
jgi:plastocyanin